VLLAVARGAARAGGRTESRESPAAAAPPHERYQMRRDGARATDAVFAQQSAPAKVAAIRRNAEARRPLPLAASAHDTGMAEPAPQAALEPAPNLQSTVAANHWAEQLQQLPWRQVRGPQASHSVPFARIARLRSPALLVRPYAHPAHPEGLRQQHSGVRPRVRDVRR